MFLKIKLLDRIDVEILRAFVSNKDEARID